MKGIQTADSTSVINQPLTNFSYAPVLQGLMDGIGWKSPAVAIYEEQKLEAERHLSFQEIEQLYKHHSTISNQKKLLAAIDKEITAAKTELRSAQHHQKETHDALMKTTSSRSIGSWLMEGVKYAFDSTPEQLIKRYSGIAKDRKAQIKKLSRYRNKIASAGTLNAYSVPQQETCYPSSFNISDLNKPEAAFRGFVMNGFQSSDQFACFSLISGLGDVNADGIDDFAVVCSGGNEAGVIFGKENIEQNGTLNFLTLNGTTGFKIERPPWGIDHISGGFDINGDYIDDFFLSSPYGGSNGSYDAGSTWIIFGNPTLDKNGTLSVSSLNGTTGFVIKGAHPNDKSGTSISSIGDFNGDDFNDIAIGAPGATPENQTSAGSTYVIFGGLNVGGNGILELSSLNETTGVIINGQVNTTSGYVVSRIGDINSDGVYDLLIWGYGINSYPIYYPPQGYVVFGSKTLIGVNGTLKLSSLNGKNGFFIVTGVSYPVSYFVMGYAGDINADGQDDFAMGTPEYGLALGATFVVFGEVNIGQNGTLAFSNLNGRNGFKLTGNEYSRSGGAISYIGDINQDGVILELFM